MTAITAGSLYRRRGQEGTRTVAVWLFAVSLLLLAMVVLGGVTRLTGSGLSITQWKPISGVLPPLNAADWAAEFDAYRQIPQYAQINPGMTVDEFKSIFWFEWAHRLLGRVIGFAFAVPYGWFLFRRQLDRPMAIRLAGILLLGGSQGLLGWFMVKSGLADRVSVSQYRLAAHLTLAFIIHTAVFWTALDLWRGRIYRNNRRGFDRAAFGLLALVLAQIILGAFVAGLDAGLAYNTWPLMDGHLIPPGMYSHQPWWLDPFENSITALFNHRTFALIVAGAVVAFWLRLHATLPDDGVKRAADLVLIAVLGQFALGVWTLLAVVPVSLGALHQAGAFILFTLVLNLAHKLRRG